MKILNTVILYREIYWSVKHFSSQSDCPNYIKCWEGDDILEFQEFESNLVYALKYVFRINNTQSYQNS